MTKDIKRLYLSDTDKKIAGVCGGIAEWLDIDSTVVRLTWIVLAALSAVVPMLLAYLVAWAVMPEKPKHVHVENENK